MHQNLPLYSVDLPHEMLVYPAKMYLPTLIIVTFRSGKITKV